MVQSLSPVEPPEAPTLPEEDKGVFTVGPDLHFLRIEASRGSRLFPEPTTQLHQSVWTVFQGVLRPPLFEAYKRLITGANGESEVTGEAEARGLCFRFSTTRANDGSGGFITHFGVHAVSNIPLPLNDRLAPVSPIPVSPPPAQTSPQSTQVMQESSLSGLPPMRENDGSDTLFQVSPDPVCILDMAGRIERVNPAWLNALGYTADWLWGRLLIDLIHPEDQPLLSRALIDRTPQDGPYSAVCRCQRADGIYRWLHFSLAAAAHAGRTRLYATARDVTESRVSEETIRWQASHDTLTSLPNRALLLDRIASALATAQRYRHIVGILFLDLDRFKRINDTLGHAAGDTLLREVAVRLREGLRDEDTIARYGGDEFVILLPRIHNVQDAVAVAEKLLQRFETPFFLAGHELHVTGSIGLSTSPEDGMIPEDLIQAADQAMYRAKEAGRGRYTRSAPINASQPLERLTLESRLRQAIDREELRLHYQPQVSLTTGRMIGVEALMRWQAGEIGSVSPELFIPLAEETGQIGRMGTWALREACHQTVSWQRAGFPLQIAVNLSASQLMDNQFPDRLEACLGEFGLAAKHMDLELTESTFIHNDAGALETLQRLKSLGVRLSVDDFGTGYSSLSYLRRFPIDGVKVDRSFITHIDTSPADEAVVRAIIDLSHTLGLEVIAEGVETVAQRDRLQALGCDIMQGYLFSAAIPPRDLTTLLQSSLPGAYTK